MLQYDYIQEKYIWGGGGICYIIIKHFFVDRVKLLDFCAILIFYSVTFDKVWKEFCVGVIVSLG